MARLEIQPSPFKKMSRGRCESKSPKKTPVCLAWSARCCPSGWAKKSTAKVMKPRGLVLHFEDRWQYLTSEETHDRASSLMPASLFILLTLDPRKPAAAQAWRNEFRFRVQEFIPEQRKRFPARRNNLEPKCGICWRGRDVLIGAAAKAAGCEFLLTEELQAGQDLADGDGNSPTASVLK